jgi:hypothetical protein
VSTATRGPGGFGGTSAATPHVTGAAALALQAGDWDADPEGLRSWLVEQAVDLPPDGVDDASGAGFLTLDAIPWHGCHCASGGGPRAASGGSFVLALALLRRRRLR